MDKRVYDAGIRERGVESDRGHTIFSAKMVAANGDRRHT